MTIKIPENYQPSLDQYKMEQAIDFIKKTFQFEFETALNLRRVSAPLFVAQASGLNDNLSGVERPVDFDVPALKGNAEVVQSLAKWKRKALKDYRFKVYEGLLTDMNAIRRDEELDNIHSIYVDQWDWEKIIKPEDRTEDYLYDTVQKIVSTICNVNHLLRARFPDLHTEIRRQVTFIHAQELEDLYPDLSPKEREYQICKEKKTVFLQGIGKKLSSGKPHDGRSPDYDDWDLNGDILFWNEILENAFEISSMGIRVNPETLDRQLNLAGANDRRSLPYHQALLNGDLPQTIGGGIGQSRLCMFLIGTCHIGEVQASLWDAETQRICQEKGILLL